MKRRSHRFVAGVLACSAALMASAATFPTDQSEFTLDVAAGETVTITDIRDYTTATLSQGSITVNKTGEGTLIFNNTVNTYTTKINVHAGTVRLARSDGKECAHYTTVRSGGTLIFDADNAVRDYAGITLYGTGVVDLNGHSDRVSYIRCEASKEGEVLQPLGKDVPSIINSSATPATLTVDNDFMTTARVGSGVNVNIAGKGYVTTYDSGAYASLQIDRYTETYSSYTAARLVMKELAAPWTETSYFGLGDISFYNGTERISASAVKSATSSSSYEGRYPSDAADNDASSWWNAGIGDAQPWLQIEFYGRVPITGYQLTIPAALNARPKSWDLYLRGQDDNCWILVDSRQDAADDIYPIVKPTTPSRVLNLNPSDLFKMPFDACSTLKVDGDLRVMPVDLAEAAALSGTGQVTVASGAIFRPGDLSNWTGSFVVRGNTLAHLQLDATAGGDEQTLSTSALSQNLSIENASSAPVALKVGGSGITSLYGTMADGNGPIALVKEGSGEVFTEMKMALNTGATEVRSGTLRVVSSKKLDTVTARYIRVRPLLILGGPTYVDEYNYNWSIGQLIFLDANGTALDLSAASCTSETGVNNYNAFTKPSADSRSIVKSGPAGNEALLGWVKIKPTSAVTFSQMKWFPSASEGTKSRNPLCLQIEVSDDDVTWRTVCIAHSESQTAIKNASGVAEVRGPFNMGQLATGTTRAVGMIPEEFVNERLPYGAGVKSLKAKHFRFCPRMTRNFGISQYDYGWTISEFDLYLNGKRLTWPSTAKVSVSQPVSEEVSRRVIDNVAMGTDHDAVRFFRTYLPDAMRIEMPEVTAFDAYGFTAAGGNYWSQRLPIDWDFMISNDRSTWYTVTMKGAQLDISKAYAVQGPWSMTEGFKSLSDTLTDAISDYAPLKIFPGARVTIDSLYEKFGTLAGAGEVSFASDATVEVNALPGHENESFSGRLVGGGTLVISGEGAQTLDGADLAGVSHLVLASGRLDGTADFGGNDLTITFAGGTLNATLSNIGTVTIDGTPRFYVPNVTDKASSVKTLLSAQTIGSDAQAALSAPTYTLAAGARAKYAKMTVTDKTATIEVAKTGIVILIK